MSRSLDEDFEVDSGARSRPGVAGCAVGAFFAELDEDGQSRLRLVLLGDASDDAITKALNDRNPPREVNGRQMGYHRNGRCGCAKRGWV